MKDYNLLSELNVLYVEDDEGIGKLLQNFLNRDVKNLYFAKDGKEGLELFKKQDLDIIITDIQMPNMNGLEMIKEIKKIDRDIPIIITTAYNDNTFLFEAIELGVRYYLIKPIDLEKLLDILLENVKLKLERVEREHTEELLRQYKLAVDKSTIFSKTDPRGVITYVNDKFCEISEYSKEELIGRPHNIVRHPDMPNSAFKELWKSIRAKKTWKGVIKNRAKSGKEYIVESTIIPILNRSGEIIEIIGFRNDITEKENYKNILESQLDVSMQGLSEKIKQLKEYEKAIDVSTSFSRTDLDGVITYVNDEFCKVSGYAREELIGNSHSLIRHPDMKDEIFKELWEKIKSKTIWKGILKNLKKSGKPYYMDTTIIPILDNSDNIREYVSIRHDITEIIELQNEIVETQKEVVFTMGAIGESRSKETGNHVKRVAEYSKALALGYGLSEEEAELLKQASPMHDIGKVAIADSILNKPAKLTEDEFKIMKTHTNLGYKMLKSSNRDILKAASIVAYQHHEKYNGRGYPQGLKAKEIHIFGRITAIADVFDALGSDRCYKKAWKLEKILNLFKEERGEHFDPTLVDVLFENLDKILEIRSKFRDE